MKNELNGIGRRLIGQPTRAMDGPNHPTKCAKRRRREPAILSTINQSANNNSKEIVGTQSTSTNSGAMKRSSQFRGVSR